jgi:rare lipoprotein A (peptidoglycan hydrolase)
MQAAICLFGAVPASAADMTPPSAVTAHAHFSEIGMASWYGDEVHGHATADGERFDGGSLTAAHRTLPLPCYARVTNLGNGRSIVVRVNDRGPFIGRRILDVSARVARLLDFTRLGAAKVRVDYVGKAPPTEADEPALLASMRPSFATAAKPSPPPESPATDTGVTVVARADYLRKMVEPHAPWGELVTYPFLVRTAGP